MSPAAFEDPAALAVFMVVLLFLISLGLLLGLIRVWVAIADMRLRRKVMQRGSVGRKS